MIPARTGGSRFADNVINTFSEALGVKSAAGYNARPISPMATAAKSEIKTQMTATFLDSANLDSSLIAIKRSSTWGIPK